VYTTQGTTTLTPDGQDGVSVAYAGLAQYFGMPAANTRYTLAVSGTRVDGLPWSELTTKIHATWTFHSAASADPAAGRLMYFRTTGLFNDYDQAPAGKPFPLGFQVLRQTGSTTTAKVKTVTLEYSTDDGATWKKAPLAGTGNLWGTIISNPASGF